MQLPLQVTFRHVDPSPALESRIRELAARLERYSDQVMGCQVTVEAPHRHGHQGALYDVRIDITVPDREIAIHRAHPRDHSHEDPYVALRDAFRAARRKLQDYERRRYLKVKHHEEVPRGRISELDPAGGYGRIETPEGRLVYFHSHSVLGRPFDELRVGDQVRFAEEPGDRGPQASTVHVLT
jgi:cold shock CspA family protein/ribosome-associated translation inhibitor RaiA